MYYWTPSGSRKGPINRVCPSFRPSFHLSGRFLGIVLLIFSKFWHGARIPCEVVRDRVGFFGKKCFVPKIGIMGQKQVFFQFIGKFGHQFLLNLIYNENLYYLLCPCTNPISENFVSEIWTQMFSANQIAGFFNQPYLHKKLMK